MSTDHPKRDSMSLDKMAISDMWGIAAILEGLGWKNASTTLLLTCLTLASNSSIMAGDTLYTCTIVSASKLTGDGALASDWSVNPFLGQEFTVDRITGRIIGGPLDNGKMTTQLIDKGSREMSFQAFAQSQGKSHTTHIQVEEFQTTEIKPFIGTTTLYFPGVYSGICK